MTGPSRGPAFRAERETPLVGAAPRLLLLGSGELGREVAIEAIRLGAEVIAADRYENAPAMHVAHRAHVLAMTDGAALRALVESERPDVIVPEIEQIDTATLVALEQEGWAVAPGAKATQATMDRERIRRIAAEEARVPTSRFGFAGSFEEARAVADRVGYPCLVKALTSSSGHGMTLLRDPSGLAAAYRDASEGGRIPNPRVMIEEFIRFDLEVTVLVLRAYDAEGQVRTRTLAPIGHDRPGTVYHESWQPAELTPTVAGQLVATAGAITDRLGGLGISGVECFVRGEEVLFSEVSPRPHDTGLVTLASQWNSEFALHARAVLGYPVGEIEPPVLAAAHVILGTTDTRNPRFRHLQTALSTAGVRVHLFGKPDSHPGRRLGVAIARAANVPRARELAEGAAHAIEAGFPRPAS
ncbi:MAG TPA: formate-dependent phosphoribosylglycinamide formyltransferase [Thermoplasmata archaeon]|nr:formate-dependent phosphoribosylglycinamide formyltransferase [Thermoplasmata archaeon]